MMMMMSEIACERILARSTGGAYDDSRHRGSWILARERLLVSFEGLVRRSLRVLGRFYADHVRFDLCRPF